mmetsp:Transcript_81969/g.229956  ORF Transcript_81969/g.229956 Transcript_81969/m.229956 type:complete len:352 (+) Transcript_81969:86-1141(+)
MFVRVPARVAFLAAWSAAAAAPASVAAPAGEQAPECSSLLQVHRPGPALLNERSQLCSPDPGADQHLADVMRRIAGNEFAEPLEAAWTAYQAKVAEEAERQHPSPKRALRVLIVSPVKSAMLEAVAFNMERLPRTGAGDVFKLALFQYDVEEGRRPVADSGHMSALLPRIELYRSGPGCSAQFWRHVTPDVVEGFGYVWMMDGDLRMDYFDWTIYRQVLLQLDPLLSQPSIVAWSPEKKSSWWHDLRMRGPDANGGRRSSAMQRFFNRFAKIAKGAGCTQTAGLVVNLSPLRHADCHDLRNGIGCGGGWFHQDCANITVAEADALVRDLDGGPGSGCGKDVWEDACIVGCS